MTTSAPHVTAIPAVNDLALAIQGLPNLVNAQRGSDEDYFLNQLPRHSRTIRRIQGLRSTLCRALATGSRYLDLSHAPGLKTRLKKAVGPRTLLSVRYRGRESVLGSHRLFVARPPQPEMHKSASERTAGGARCSMS